MSKKNIFDVNLIVGIGTKYVDIAIPTKKGDAIGLQINFFENEKYWGISAIFDECRHTRTQTKQADKDITMNIHFDIKKEDVYANVTRFGDANSYGLSITATY